MVIDAQYEETDYTARKGLDDDLVQQMKAYRHHTALVWANYYPLDYAGMRGPRLRWAQSTDENELQAVMKEAASQGWCRQIYQQVSERLPWMSKLVAQVYRAEDTWQCSAREAVATQHQQQEQLARVAHQTANRVLAAAEGESTTPPPLALSYHELEAEETGHLLFDGRPGWAQASASLRVADTAMDVDRVAVPSLEEHANIMSGVVHLNLNTVHVRFRLATLLAYLEDTFGSYSVQVRAAGGVWLMAVAMLNPHNELLTNEAMRIRDVVCSVAGVGVYNVESLVKSLVNRVSEQLGDSWTPEGRKVFELACMDVHPGYAEALVCTFHFAHKMRWHSGHYYNWLGCLNHYDDWRPVNDTKPKGLLSETCPMPGEGPTACMLRRLGDCLHEDDEEEQQQQQQQRQQPGEQPQRTCGDEEDKVSFYHERLAEEAEKVGNGWRETSQERRVREDREAEEAVREMEQREEEERVQEQNGQEWPTHDSSLPSAPPAYEDVVNTQRREDAAAADDSDDALEPRGSRRLYRLRKRLPMLKLKQVARENDFNCRRRLCQESYESHPEQQREWAEAGHKPSESLAKHRMTRHPRSKLPDIFQVYRMDRWRFAWFGATPGNDPRYTYKWLMCLLQNESFAIKHEFLSGEPTVTKGWL
jgi:hypothetical protein